MYRALTGRSLMDAQRAVGRIVGRDTQCLDLSLIHIWASRPIAARAEMEALVYGGAASGKSRYAEDLLCALSCEGPRIYLATMEAMDEESRARVRRHRALRRNKGFSTLECPRDLGGLTIPVGSSVLLEDLGNLWANELFSPSGFDPDGALLRTAEGLERLSVQAQNLSLIHI